MTPARRLLTTFRLRAQKLMPYLGQFIYTMRPVESPGIGTLSVDIEGNIYYDPAFLESVDEDVGAYCVLHEVLHLLLRHCDRFRNMFPAHTEAERLTFNIAADLCVEQTLKALRGYRPEGVVCIDDYLRIPGMMPNLSVEEYFHLLCKEEDEKPEQPSPGDSPQPQDSQPQGSAPQEPPPEKAKAPGPLDPGKAGSSSDGQERDYEVPRGEGFGPIRVEVAVKELERQIEAYEAGGKAAGEVPGELKQAIRARLRPQPNPWDILRSTVARSVSCSVGPPDYTYRRFSRRQQPDIPRLRGSLHNQPTAVLVIDTSGSMDCDKERCVNVIAQGLRRVRRPHVVCGDTYIRGERRVTSLEQFQWCGGGGTNMARIVEEVDRKHRPDAIILVTDGETPWPTKPTRARLVVALTRDRRAPSWAKVVRLPKK